MERPIVFSTEMVRAILEGRKSQTRRVIKPQAHHYNADLLQPYILYPCYSDNDFGDIDKPIVCPYQPGDILWVRETWGIPIAPIAMAGRAIYKADYQDGNAPLADGEKWRSPIHMPREVARLFLRVKNVRVERVQDITEKDAKAEGVEFWDVELYCKSDRCFYAASELNPVDRFHALWDWLNAKRGYGWHTNPWVWVIEFEKIAHFKEDVQFI